MFKGLPLFYEKGQAGETPHSAEFLFWFNGPLRQYVSLYRAVSLRKGEGGEQE